MGDHQRPPRCCHRCGQLRNKGLDATCDKWNHPEDGVPCNNCAAHMRDHPFREDGSQNQFACLPYTAPGQNSKARKAQKWAQKNQMRARGEITTGPAQMPLPPLQPNANSAGQQQAYLPPPRASPLRDQQAMPQDDTRQPQQPPAGADITSVLTQLARIAQNLQPQAQAQPPPLQEDAILAAFRRFQREEQRADSRGRSREEQHRRRSCSPERRHNGQDRSQARQPYRERTPMPPRPNRQVHAPQHNQRAANERMNTSQLPDNGLFAPELNNNRPDNNDSFDGPNNNRPGHRQIVGDRRMTQRQAVHDGTARDRPDVFRPATAQEPALMNMDGAWRNVQPPATPEELAIMNMFGGRRNRPPPIAENLNNGQQGTNASGEEEEATTTWTDTMPGTTKSSE